MQIRKVERKTEHAVSQAMVGLLEHGRELASHEELAVLKADFTLRIHIHLGIEVQMKYKWFDTAVVTKALGLYDCTTEIDMVTVD